MENNMEDPQKLKQNYHMIWQSQFWVYIQKKKEEDIEAMNIIMFITVAKIWKQSKSSTANE